MDNINTDTGSTSRESVWDYPRPPRLELSQRHLVVRFADETIAETRRAHRILETSHPPVFYLPREDVEMSFLEPLGPATTSFCEWKGAARYFDVRVGERSARRAAWTYPRPAAPYEAIADAIAFYPSRMDRCTVDGEFVEAQAGDFYGGWITRDIRGPFKGGAGTHGW